MQGCEQAMAVMLAKLPTRPFAGMTQIRFKGFGLRHLSPHGTPLGSAMLYDIHLLNTITAPPCRRMMVMGDSQRFSAQQPPGRDERKSAFYARNSFVVGAEYRF